MCLFLVSIIFMINCEKQEESVNHKYGKYKVVTDNLQINFIERNSDFQLMYSPQNENLIEFSKLTWKTNTVYTKEVLNKKNKFDSLTFDVKVHNLQGVEVHHETTMIKEVDLKVTSKLIKISDSLSNRFNEFLRKYNK